MALINVHMDPTDAGEIVWWADSPVAPGFSAAADSLVALQLLVKEAAREHDGLRNEALEYSLVGDEPTSDTEGSIVTDQVTVDNAGVGGRSRSELVTV